MRHPALAVSGVDHELALAAADDCDPTAADETADGLRLFFPDATRRDRALDLIRQAWPDARVLALDVDDEDWARRSQENLTPITVGGLTILPVPLSPDPPGPRVFTGADASPRLSMASARRGRRRSLLDPPDLPGLPHPPDLRALRALVILPSTGFGTGHHATTRLCLEALQRLDLEDKSLLDVGTGSGILAMAARLLGARSAIGIDSDPEAIRAANENLTLNAEISGVEYRVGDLFAPGMLPDADVVVANLTGTLLRRAASTLLDAVRPGGFLIVSGLLVEERADVLAAFAATRRIYEADEGEWAALTFERLPPP